MTQSNAQKETGTLRGDQNRLIFQQGFSFSGYERDALFLNREGKNYFDLSGVSGIDSITDGRAAVFADFDNDGDYDVFLTTIQGTGHLLFRNNVGQNNHWLRIELEGGKDVGRDAFSSVVRVKTSAGTLTKVKAGGSGYLSEHDPRLLFGLGQDERAQAIEVTWPNGKVEAFQADASAGKTLLLREGTGKAEEVVVPSANLPDPLTRAQMLARTLKIQIGQPLPDLKVKLLPSGESSFREQLKPGRRTLVNLWATWCTPCRHEMPELERIRKPLAEHGVDLIGLNVDTDPAANITAFLKQTGAGYPVLLGGAAAVEKIFEGEELSVPLTLLLDEKGVVKEIIPGWSGTTRQKFMQLAGEN